MIKELDNFPLDRVELLLNKDTTLARYYPLIPLCEQLLSRLTAAGIVDKYACLSLSIEETARLTALDTPTAALFHAFLHLHDFRERRLSEITCVPPQLIAMLAADGVKTSSDCIFLCAERGVAAVGTAYGGAEDDAERLLRICDLMRLPGCKSTRAELYVGCGYGGLCAFANESAETMRAHIAEVIVERFPEWGVPLPKELRTQIAVAKVLPDAVGAILTSEGQGTACKLC